MVRLKVWTETEEADIYCLLLRARNNMYILTCLHNMADVVAYCKKDNKVHKIIDPALCSKSQKDLAERNKQLNHELGIIYNSVCDLIILPKPADFEYLESEVITLDVDAIRNGDCGKLTVFGEIVNDSHQQIDIYDVGAFVFSVADFGKAFCGVKVDIGDLCRNLILKRSQLSANDQQITINNIDRVPTTECYRYLKLKCLGDIVAITYSDNTIVNYVLR